MITISPDERRTLMAILESHLFQHSLARIARRRGGDWDLTNKIHQFLLDNHKITIISQEELNRLQQENKVLKEFKEDWEDDYRKIVNNSCYPDEKHCSCVPFLHLQIKNLKANI